MSHLEETPPWQNSDSSPAAKVRLTSEYLTAMTVLDTTGSLSNTANKILAYLEIPPLAFSREVLTRFSPPAAASEEQRLKDDIEKHVSNPDVRKDLQDNLEAFKARAKEQGLKEEEVAKTLAPLCRLLEAKDGKIASEARLLLAQGLMSLAAKPDKVLQYGPTCGSTTAEFEACRDTPSVAVALATATALDGHWKGKDGKDIKLDDKDSLVASNYKPEEYAGHVLQYAINNDIGQHVHPPMRYICTKPVEHADGGPGTGRGRSVSVTRDHFWVLEDGKRKPFAEPGKGVFSQTGGVTSFEVANEIYRLTGKANSVVCNRKYDTDDTPAKDLPDPKLKHDNLSDVRSEREFETLLQQLKERKQLPIVASVCAGAVAALDGSLVDKQKGKVPGHFVSLVDYKPAQGDQPAKVLVHNQWGPKYNGWMKVEDVFKALGQDP